METKEVKKTENIYCVKCKKKVPVENPETITMKSDRLAITGKCPICGTTTYQIIAGKG